MARAGVLGFPGYRGFTSGSAPLIPAKTFQYTNGSVTLSNGDSTATFNTDGGYDAVNSEILATSGKIYFEFFSDCRPQSSIYGGWILNKTASASGGTTDPSGWSIDRLAYRCNQTTLTAVGTGYSATATALTAYNASTSTFGFAVDMTTGNVWIRQDSATWLSGDPVAGTGAIGTIPASSVTLHIGSSDFRQGIVTIISPSSYSWAAPSGFTGV